MSKLPECPICEESYCPINSVDENGDWDGSSKQNCDCDIIGHRGALEGEVVPHNSCDGCGYLCEECDYSQIGGVARRLLAENKKLKEWQAEAMSLMYKNINIELGKGDIGIGMATCKKTGLIGIGLRHLDKEHEIGEGEKLSINNDDLFYSIMSSKVESLHVLRNAVNKAIDKFKEQNAQEK